MERLLRRMACWCVILLGVVVVVLTGTFALEASVGIVELIDEISKRKKQVKQNNGTSHAKGDALAKAQRQIADLQKKLHAGGNTGEENDKSKVSKWTKGLPKWMRPESLSTGVSTSPPTLEEAASTPDNGVLRQCADALRAMANPAHQQMAAALTAFADEHRAAKQKEMPLTRRVQQLDIKIEKKKRAVDSLEATHGDLSQFIQHLQTLLQKTSKQVQDTKTELAQFQTEGSEVVNGSSLSEEQKGIEVLLRRALPQPDETLNQQMEAVVRAAAAFRTRSSGPSAAEPMHKDLQSRVGSY